MHCVCQIDRKISQKESIFAGEMYSKIRVELDDAHFHLGFT